MAAMGTAVAPRVHEPSAPPVERYGELEGHRGIAIVGLVIFHTYQFCSVSGDLYAGTIGYTLLSSLDATMPWFYVLTAFLLFEPIARSIVEGTHPVSTRAYLKRRAVRILPAYYLAVVIAWFPRQQTLPGDWRDLLEHLTFTQVFDHKRIFYTIGPAASLSVEVWFYLVLALLVVGLTLACRRLTNRRWRITAVSVAIAAVAAVSLAWKAWSFAVEHRATTGSPTTWLGPLANLDVFAVGMALAVVAAIFGGSRPLGPRLQMGVRLIALAVLVVAFVTRTANTWSAVYFYSECAVGFGLLIAGAVLGSPEGRWSRMLGCRPLAWLGGISFGIFLWHEPIMLALRTWDHLVRQSPGAFVRDTIVVLIVSTIAGWMSRLLIERPGSRLGGVFNRDGRLRSSIPTPGGDGVEWETFRTGNPF